MRRWSFFPLGRRDHATMGGLPNSTRRPDETTARRSAWRMAPCASHPAGKPPWARLDSNQRPTDYECDPGSAAGYGCSLIWLWDAESSVSPSVPFAAVSGCRVAPRWPQRPTAQLEPSGRASRRKQAPGRGATRRPGFVPCESERGLCPDARSCEDPAARGPWPLHLFTAAISGALGRRWSFRRSIFSANAPTLSAIPRSASRLRNMRLAAGPNTVSGSASATSPVKSRPSASTVTGSYAQPV